MSRDNQSKLSKKEQNNILKKHNNINKIKKNVASDSDSDSDYDDDEEEEEEDTEMDMHEYQKFISKLFPSKYIDEKVKATEKINKDKDKDKDKDKTKTKTKTKTKFNKKEEEEEEWETDSEQNKNKNKKIKQKNKNKNKNKNVENDDDEDDDENDEDDVHNNKLNIILTIGGVDDNEYEDDYDSEFEDDDDDDETENEDEEVSTDETTDTDEENNSNTEEEEDDEKPIKKKYLLKDKKDKKDKKEEDNNENDNNEKDNIEKDDTNIDGILNNLKELLLKNPQDKSIQKCINIYESDIKNKELRVNKKNKKQKDKNMRIFKKIIKDKNTMNDFIFYEKLPLTEQIKIIKELKEINKITRIEKPYRMTLLESNIPVQFKSCAMKKINSLRYMEPGSGEFYKIKNWVDTFMRIPFVKYEELPISIEDGVDKCHAFMENAQQILEQAVYGLNDAKMQIMQLLGQLLTNPKAIGTAIAIHGPPGTGKTSLIKEGISKILKRPFAFIALGGATDSSFLEGHSYTYEGSTWGKIVQILINSKCMNPVIYFDELDKISDTPRGEEIAGILTHLTDTSQNMEFHDKYFSEINFDLSKCLFIFSYNDESKINPILKDRMYRIKTNGYNGKEKTVITNNYLLPKIREQIKFNIDEIIIKDDVISYIVENYCNKEDGVRNLKRCLEIIHTKLNLYRLMKPNSNLFEKEMSLKVEFPYNVTKDIVDKLIKVENTSTALLNMYI